MFNIMKDYHQKFNNLNNRITRTKRKQEVLTSVDDFYNQLYYICKSKYNNKIDTFMKKKIKKTFDYKKLRLSYNYQYPSDKEQEKEQKEKESEENKFFKYIENKSKGISYDLFKKYFDFEKPNQLTKNLFETKDKEKNNDFAKEIMNRSSKLKDEIKEMSKEEKEIEKPDKILKIIENCLILWEKLKGKIME